MPAHPRVITATVIALRRAWTTAERNQARPPAGRWSGYRSDNFVIESFFATLESELLHRHRVRTRTAASLAVFHHLEGFYSPRRATRPWGASAQRTTKGATSPGYASTKPGHRLRERCLQIREGVLDAFASRSVLKTPGPVRAGVPVIALQAAAQAGTPESCVGPNLMKGCCCNPKPSGNTGHSGLAREKSGQKLGDGTWELEPVIRPVKVEDHRPAIRVIIVSPPVENLAIESGTPRDETTLLRVQRIGNRYSGGRQRSQGLDRLLELPEEIQTGTEATRNGHPDVLLEVSRAKSFRECFVVGRQTPAKLVLDPFPVDPHPGRGRQVDDLSQLFDVGPPHLFHRAHRTSRRVMAI